MPVLNANIRTFNSYAESPKLYNFVFVAHAWRVPWGEKCKLDSGRLRRKRRSPQAWRPSEEPRPVLYPGGGLGSPFHWLQTNLVQPSPRWALGTQARLHFCPWPLCLNPHGQVTLKGILKVGAKEYRLWLDTEKDCERGSPLALPRGTRPPGPYKTDFGCWSCRSIRYSISMILR